MVDFWQPPQGSGIPTPPTRRAMPGIDPAALTRGLQAFQQRAGIVPPAPPASLSSALALMNQFPNEVLASMAMGQQGGPPNKLAEQLLVGRLSGKLAEAGAPAASAAPTGQESAPSAAFQRPLSGFPGFARGQQARAMADTEAAAAAPPSVPAVDPFLGLMPGSTTQPASANAATGPAGYGPGFTPTIPQPATGRAPAPAAGFQNLPGIANAPESTVPPAAGYQNLPGIADVTPPDEPPDLETIRPAPGAGTVPTAATASTSTGGFDPYMALLQGGLSTMAAGAQKGATTLGSLGVGGLAALQGAAATRKERREDVKEARVEARETRKLDIETAKVLSDAKQADAKLRQQAADAGENRELRRELGQQSLELKKLMGEATKGNQEAVLALRERMATAENNQAAAQHYEKRMKVLGEANFGQPLTAQQTAQVENEIMDLFPDSAMGRVSIRGKIADSYAKAKSAAEQQTDPTLRAEALANAEGFRQKMLRQYGLKEAPARR